VYTASAVVHHRVAPERIDLEFMQRTFLELGVGLARAERIDGAPLPTLVVRLVRAFRTVAGARRCVDRNRHVQRTGTATWDELYGLMWAGKHVEMLLGRFPKLTDGCTALIARAV
jgi:hypothetical protein